MRWSVDEIRHLDLPYPGYQPWRKQRGIALSKVHLPRLDQQGVSFVWRGHPDPMEPIDQDVNSHAQFSRWCYKGLHLWKNTSKFKVSYSASFPTNVHMYLTSSSTICLSVEYETPLFFCCSVWSVFSLVKMKWAFIISQVSQILFRDTTFIIDDHTRREWACKFFVITCVRRNYVLYVSRILKFYPNCAQKSFCCERKKLSLSIAYFVTMFLTHAEHISSISASKSEPLNVKVNIEILTMAQSGR